MYTVQEVLEIIKFFGYMRLTVYDVAFCCSSSEGTEEGTEACTYWRGRL